MLSIDGTRKISSQQKIANGDLIIVYERHDTMKAIKVSDSSELQNRFGVFKHGDWIGKSYGSKVLSNKGGFIYFLAPTPELWTLVLSHRTQILNISDITFVVSFLEIVPGCVVLESGTGGLKKSGGLKSEKKDGGNKNEMKKSLTWWDLLWFGIGSVMGAGIFVLTGQEANGHAGPAVVLSFAVSGFAALLSVFCYTEFAVDIPVAGGSFAYIRVELGDFVAFVAAGNILFEYVVYHVVHLLLLWLELLTRLVMFILLIFMNKELHRLGKVSICLLCIVLKTVSHIETCGQFYQSFRLIFTVRLVD
ncbi:hypothetical protein IFM89_025332 [Coptis chinensis]|uniref:tRNA (adenine(58)-N(1))-methyltransferase n=1 Tax=Coptis chinensis TaxID=261450 RepID=A0A835LX76_9MAGN|nr:hypothetical protein IFM89_025332 [Coptis chinensis]